MSDTVQPLNPADAGVLRACYENHVAAMTADDPFEPPVSLDRFTARMRTGISYPSLWCRNPVASTECDVLMARATGLSSPQNSLQNS